MKRAPLSIAGIMGHMTVTLRPLRGELDEMADLQRVLEGAPTYFELTTGHPPGAAEAQSLFTVLPPEGLDYADKFDWGIVTEAGLVGCIDVLRGWPTADTAHLGLMLISEDHVGQGIGRAAFEALEHEVRRWPGITRLRAAVVATNAQVLPFWKRMGFTETGEVKPYVYDKLHSESIILAKHLT
jgi:GNAT superfamily N-acetyltransferase